jgi:hypothetical protein
MAAGVERETTAEPWPRIKRLGFTFAFWSVLRRHPVREVSLR